MLYLGRGSLADGTLPRRSKVFFYFIFYILSFSFYLALSAFDNDHAGAELAGTFVFFSFLLLFSFLSCLSVFVGDHR